MPDTPKPPWRYDESCALPEPVRVLVRNLLEGTVCDLVLVATLRDGTIVDGMFYGIDGNQTQPYVTLGALEVIKRDWVDGTIQLRVDMKDLSDKEGG